MAKPKKKFVIRKFQVVGFNGFGGLSELSAHKEKHNRIQIELEGNDVRLATAYARALALEILRLCNEIEQC